MNRKTPFKVCPCCGAVWRTRGMFLSDPHLSLVGYQVNYGELEAGLFLFNHDVEHCRTSLAIAAGRFTDMHKGPIFESRLENTGKCAGHCLRESDLLPCPNKCECAYVRDVIQEIRKRLEEARAASAAHLQGEYRPGNETARAIP